MMIFSNSKSVPEHTHKRRTYQPKKKKCLYSGPHVYIRLTLCIFHHSQRSRWVDYFGDNVMYLLLQCNKHEKVKEILKLKTNTTQLDMLINFMFYIQDNYRRSVLNVLHWLINTYTHNIYGRFFLHKLCMGRISQHIKFQHDCMYVHTF